MNYRRTLDHPDECALLEALDETLQSEYQARDRLGHLARRLLDLRGMRSDHLSNDEAITAVAETKAGAEGLTVVASLVHLLATDPSTFWDGYDAGGTFRRGANRLVEKYLGGTLKHLDVDKRSQPHEKVVALESASAQAYQAFEEALQPLRGLSRFSSVRQRVMRRFNQSLIEELIVPLLPRRLQARHFDEVLQRVQEYKEAPLREKSDAYASAAAEVRQLSLDADEFKSARLSNVVRSFVGSLDVSLAQDYERSGLAKPAELRVQPLDKRYPFAINGADIKLGFSVGNVGDGVAFESELRVVDNDSAIEMQSRVRRLAEVAPGERIEPVDLGVKVVTPTVDDVGLICELRWLDGDGTARSSEQAMLWLGSQPDDIPWNELERRNPYSLEPVTTMEDLIGRQSQVDSLVSRICAAGVGSSWVHGQKRVGKTSLVKVLRDLKALEDHSLIYVESGDFVAPDAIRTVNSLGERICRKVRRLHPSFNSISTPTFAGALSPLVDFLEDCCDRVEDFRLVIIIDEFDELPEELYRRGGPGEALFLTMRSISGKEPFGFILVGGERMPAILDAQGEVLNKFLPLRVDYLDSENQWGDFEELVRHPVRSWIEFQDDAVRKLYDYAAGNPFFTKYICGVLFKDMVARRDAYVSQPEAELAVAEAVDSVGSQQFQHFWEDGIWFETSTERDLELARRRTVLLAVADMRTAGLELESEKVVEKAASYGVHLDESGAEYIVNDFLRREVLVEEEGVLSCKVRFFEKWLTEYGRVDLRMRLAQEDRIEADLEKEAELQVRPVEVARLAGGWPMYKGRRIDPQTIRAWLDQFKTIGDQRLAFDILCGVDFYGEDRVRESFRTGHSSVRRALAEEGIARRQEEGARKSDERVLLTWFGAAGKSGHGMARSYADENEIYYERVVHPEKLTNGLERHPDTKAIVFVDDLIGTGNSAREGIELQLTPISQDLAERRVTVFVIAVTGFAQGADRVKRTVERLGLRGQVRLVNPLDDTNRCFHKNTTLEVTGGDVVRARRMAEKYGRRLVERFPLGFGQGELALTFSHNCPNNSLPILWSDNDGWFPLFRRG